MGHMYPLLLTPESDITATSTLGPKFSGTVQINTLGINPSLGLVNLAVQPVDVTGLIAQGCPADVGPRSSKFVVTGRGGLPPNPREAIRSDQPLVDLGMTVPGQENRASDATSTNPTSSEPAPLVEAQGWVTNDKGEVVLIANAPSLTPDIPWLRHTNCHMQ
jgi:large exoprotein involved in heme utilization and adhesion